MVQEPTFCLLYTARNDFSSYMDSMKCIFGLCQLTSKCIHCITSENSLEAAGMQLCYLPGTQKIVLVIRSAHFHLLTECNHPPHPHSSKVSREDFYILFWFHHKMTLGVYLSPIFFSFKLKTVTISSHGNFCSKLFQKCLFF